MPDLIHYSKDAAVFFCSRVQNNDSWSKPLGLWFSVEDGWGWADWCIDSGYRICRLKFAFKIKLNPKVYILELRNFTDLISFTEKYKLADRDGRNKYVSKIDWISVAKKYNGIIIAPYCSRSLTDPQLTWYYGWDCSSGCIWNEQALLSNKLERNLEYEKKTNNV